MIFSCYDVVTVVKPIEFEFENDGPLHFLTYRISFCCIIYVPFLTSRSSKSVRVMHVCRYQPHIVTVVYRCNTLHGICGENEEIR